MIQRIQTLFLLLSAGSLCTLFMFPFATSDAATASFLADRQYDITDHPALMGLTILGTALALIAIFVFRQRPLQLKLGYGVIITAILLPLAAFLLFTNESKVMDTAVVIDDQAGMFLPAAAALFGALANYFIRKDDRLVKSMDRLR